MTVRSQQDFATGIMFIVTGAAFSIGATRYSIGDALDMGSGYFPLYLGIMLAGIGIVVMALAVTEVSAGPVLSGCNENPRPSPSVYRRRNQAASQLRGPQ